MTLKDLKTGQTASVTNINCQGNLKRRLMDLGIVRGTQITLVRFAPLGDPIEISLRGYSLTIRIKDAMHIEMERLYEK